MRSIRMSKKQMEKRIARFGSLKPLPIQNASIPQKARDVVYARRLLSVIGLASETPINSGAPIVGAAGMTMLRSIDHSSTLTMVQTAMRAPSGNLSGGRSTIAE